MQAHIEVTFSCTGELVEIISAELAVLGYEGFWEHDDRLSVYIPQARFDAAALEEILQGYGISHFEQSLKMPENWNQVWESNYEPVRVDDRVYIRAPFHEPIAGITHDLVIQPKMSFGTGHHETTQLMIRNMLMLDFAGKRVLDMGCGTGILGILASRLSAASVIAIDHEEWAWENTRENAAVNGVKNLEAFWGSQDSIPAGPFDIILSNITRNINLQLLPVYRNILSPGGFTVLSGFYTADLDEIIREGSSLQLHPLHQLQLHHWTSIILKNTENIHA